MKKATMQDVAKLAGVSQSTVSFVFSGADMRISESTKQKVFEAASELGFVPRGKLKNYHKVSDSVLALLVPNMSNLYYPALAKEVDEIAAAKGYGLIVINTNRSETKEARYFKLLISLKVAGILYGFTPAAGEMETARRLGLPVAIVGETEPGTAADCVSLNSGLAGELLAEHLLHFGHKKIAVITAPKHSITLSRKRRIDGMKRVLSGRAELIVISGDTEQEMEHANYEIELGYQKTKELFEIGGGRPTAVVGINDMTAIGILKALQELGLKVPEDVSCAGFDNLPVSEFVSPALTSVDHLTAQRTRQAIDLIDDKINKRNKYPVTVDFQPRLVVRSSTQKAKI
ncbi:LacI family DNA-binding transcriptional regulator [Congzhengia minquanensis]|uniref:LacI family DNA-binding transcriptional regulator n=1 Tax=Congzhengia minquanensis TaxID=2763657 RepID=A0A926DM71_9FIRM|nr:LacI family DNA-binding transcriptional regulator [Congzhengia minquanensis]MBC8541553.1 LacI family DNA-binding transcriptional regulator [Congzhengia minquanensis]